jgi:hypothetical protein
MVEVDHEVVGTLTVRLDPKDGALDAVTSTDPIQTKTTCLSANFVEEGAIL